MKKCFNCTHREVLKGTVICDSCNKGCLKCGSKTKILNQGIISAPQYARQPIIDTYEIFE